MSARISIPCAAKDACALAESVAHASPVSSSESQSGEMGLLIDNRVNQVVGPAAPDRPHCLFDEIPPAVALRNPTVLPCVCRDAIAGIDQFVTALHPAD